MTLTPRTLVVFGAAFGLLAVACGAFGAHGLKKIISPDNLVIFETGARYHMYHAFALLAAAWLLRDSGSHFAAWAGLAFILGILIFSGSLYALAITNIRILGAITPIGGVALMIGWFLMILAALKGRF